MAIQPHARDSIWDDYETEETNRPARSMPTFGRIAIAVTVVALAILALSKL